MDNLAHALFGMTLAAAMAPEVARTHRLRLLLTGAAIANVPDVDLVLTLVSKETYYFHHRGLTHSVLGFFLVDLPLCWWLFGRAMGSRWPAGPGSAWKKLGFIAVQLWLGHFFLDWLTAYGTMLAYPDLTRFSYPLMFIVDPVFWLITAVGAAALWLPPAPSARRLSRTALVTLAAVVAWWSTELAFKVEASSRHTEVLGGVPPLRLDAYPGPLGPTNWKVVATTSADPSAYLPFAVSFLNGRTSALPIPEGFTTDRVCDELADTAPAVAAFDRFHRWSEQTVCRTEVFEGHPGCMCQCLKYSFDPAYEVVPFGSFFIPAEGQGARVLERTDVGAGARIMRELVWDPAPG